MPTHRISDLVTNAHMPGTSQSKSPDEVPRDVDCASRLFGLTSESMIKRKLMGGAHRAISIHVGSLVPK